MLDKFQLAEKLNVCVSTINNLMTRGIPYYKIGKSVRFDYDEVMEWIKQNNKEGK